MAGLIFGREAAQGHVVAQIEGLLGHEGATAVQAMIESAPKPGVGNPGQPNLAFLPS